MYFLLLVLEIMINFSPDASCKRSKFFKTLLEKRLKFALSRKNNTITYNLSFVLLLVEVNLVLKK